MTKQRWSIFTTDQPSPIRDRWTARPAGTGDETEAGALLRQAVRRQPLDSEQLAAIQRRLREEGRFARAGWIPTGSRFRHRVWQVAVALALVLLGGGLMAGASRFIDWPVLHPPARSVSPPPPAAPAVSVTRMRAPAPLPSLEPAVVAAPVVVPAPAPVRRAPRVAGFSPAESSPQPPPFEAPAPAASAPGVSPIAEEAVLLGTALRKLRQDNDPGAALALLDKHDARFAAASALAVEAKQTRIEALLRQGQHGTALTLLDTLTPAASGYGRELLATRGELRSRAGRCAEALADFETLMAAPGSSAGDAIAERALYGRAGCRVRRGDSRGARADLENYLERFPSGRFAAAARAALRPVKGLDDSFHEVK